MSTTVLLTSVLALSLLLVPRLFSFTCVTIGRNLRSRVSSRLILLLERASSGEKDNINSQTQQDGEWERIENHSLGGNGIEDTVSEWNGVIGFFHPFW